MRDLGRRKLRTIVLVTHDAEVAGACDRVIPMRDGRVAGLPGAALTAKAAAGRAMLRVATA